jgi:tRNA (Thr-GGU) A37 N-methylase
MGMNAPFYSIEPIGTVRSELTRLEDAPMQGDEGAPEAWLELTPQAAPGLRGVATGDELIVLTWLHLAERDVLQVHPRGDLNRPLTEVFATRSPDRPNPIGRTRSAEPDRTASCFRSGGDVAEFASRAARGH